MAGTTESKLEYLIRSKEDVRLAINRMLVPCPEDTPFLDYGPKIKQVDVDLSDATVTSDDLMEGVIAYDSKEQRLVGNIPNIGPLNFEPSDEEYIIPYGRTDGGKVNKADITKLAEYEACLKIANSVDNLDDYSNTTATAEDIKEGKTAYSNGELIIGTMFNNTNNAEMIDVNSIYVSKFAFKEIISKLDFTNVDFKNINNFDSAFADFQYLEEIKNFNPKNITTMSSLCYRCSKLHSINEVDTSKLLNRASSLGGAFEGCPMLSDESLNNILAMCINAVKLYPEYRTLQDIGLTQAQAEKCKSLPNWQAFLDAGLTTGY